MRFVACYIHFDTHTHATTDSHIYAYIDAHTPTSRVVYTLVLMQSLNLKYTTTVFEVVNYC